MRKMKKRHLVIMIMIVLTVGLILGTQKQPKQWQYARLRYKTARKWSWTAPGVYAEGNNVIELCKKLGIKIPPNIGSSSDEANLFAVVDWAGSEGWELVLVSQYVEFSAGWFKKPK